MIKYLPLVLIIVLCLWSRSIAAQSGDAPADGLSESAAPPISPVAEDKRSSPANPLATSDKQPPATEDPGQADETASGTVAAPQETAGPNAEAEDGDSPALADEQPPAGVDGPRPSGQAESAEEQADAPAGGAAGSGGGSSAPTPPAGLEEVIVISKQQEKSDRVVSRLLSAEEIFRIPALRDDALGAINTFAAVATLQGDFNGPQDQGYYFRGGNLDDNHFEIDGLAVPYIYHLGGPFAFSVINGRLIDRLKFYASNPDINYPNVSGGVIDVGLKQPILEGINQEYDIGALSAGAMVEGGFGNGRDGYWLAARRSYIDFFLNAANLGPNDGNDPNEDGPTEILRFPEFYDIQGRWYRELDDGYTDLTFIFSRDKLLVRFGNRPQDPQFSGDLGNRRSYAIVGWRYQREPSDSNLHRLQINYSFPRERFIIGTQGREDPNPGSSFGVEDISRILNLDYDHSWQPRDKFGLRYGVDLTLDNTGTEGYLFRSPSPDDGIPSDGITTLQADFLDEDVVNFRQEAHLSLRYLPLPELTLELAARTLHTQRAITDRFGRELDIYFGGVSPRFHATYALTDRISLFYRWGDYLQLPNLDQLNIGVGSPEHLDMTRSRSNLLGLNLLFDGGRLQHDLSFELWHRELHDLIFPRSADCAGPDCYRNSGSGLAYGFDIEWTFRGGRKQYFRLAYSWLVTERRNNPFSPVYPSPADQPHTLKLLYSGPLTRSHDRWLWGFFLTIHSGQPYTPVINRIIREEDSELFFEPEYAPVNSTRFPAFVQLNLGFSYTSPSGRWESQFSLLSAHQPFYSNVREIEYDEEYSNFREPRESSEDFLIPSFVVIFRP